MLLPYATVKPHDPDACPDKHGAISPCHPRARGHWTCQNPNCPGRGDNNGRGRIATLQTQRHATDAEYAALPLAHTPIDGIARQAVFMCDECAEDSEAHEPFCTHPPPALPPCPKCGAGADQMCVKKDGVTALGFVHSDRPARVYDRCTHAHRPDCEIFTGCPCTGDDTPPARPPHPARAHIDGPGPDTSRLLFDVELAQMLLAAQNIHWWQVRRVDSRVTQDNKPCLWAEVAQIDDAGHLRYDDHGHEILQEVVILLDAPPRGQLTPAPPALPPVDAPPGT